MVAGWCLALLPYKKKVVVCIQGGAFLSQVWRLSPSLGSLPVFYFLPQSKDKHWFGLTSDFKLAVGVNGRFSLSVLGLQPVQGCSLSLTCSPSYLIP